MYRFFRIFISCITVSIFSQSFIVFQRISTRGSTLNFQKSDNEAEVPKVIQSFNYNLVKILKDGLSICFGDRHFARFYALETIARVPYFSYTSVLHLYETLGWFRKKELIKLHFAESWNELHHLLIMEELGGNKLFRDRFVAQHIAFFYYCKSILIFSLSHILFAIFIYYSCF